MRIFFTLMLLCGVAAAQARRSAKEGAASVEFVVERGGGGYDVTVSPTFVTVFYLPEKVTKAFASNQKDFAITLMGDSVAVRPSVDKPGLTANLNIDTKSLHISVVLKIGAAAEAVSQVIFTRAAEKAEIDRKVEAALAPLRAKLEEEERNLRTHIQTAADAAMAEAMARAFVVQELDAIARNDANVVARVPRAVRVGDSVYVQVTVQNRGAAPYLIKRATLAQEKREVGGQFSFQPREGDLGKVEPGQSGRGVVVVPARDLAAGRAFELRLVEEPGGATLAVAGLRAP